MEKNKWMIFQHLICAIIIKARVMVVPTIGIDRGNLQL